MTIDGIAPDGYPSGLYARATSAATGNAGDITLTTPSLTLSNGGSILARSSSTTGGNILVNADHLKLLNGSEISSSVAGDEFSDGGNVTINSINMVALNGSSVTAKANQGKGGNILVNAEVFLHDAASVDEVLNASSQVAGNDGTVQKTRRPRISAAVSRRCQPVTSMPPTNSATAVGWATGTLAAVSRYRGAARCRSARTNQPPSK